QSGGVARARGAFGVQEGVQSSHCGEGAGGRGGGEGAASVGTGAQLLQPGAELLRIHGGGIDVPAREIGEIAGEVAAVGPEGVLREPPLDAQMAEVLLEDPAVTGAQRRLLVRPRIARRHRVTKGSIARATNRTVR